MQHNRTQTKRLEFTMSIHVVFEKAADPEVKTEPPVVLTTEPSIIYLATDIDHCLESTADELLELIEEYEGVGSGWTLDHLDRLDTSLMSCYNNNM